MNLPEEELKRVEERLTVVLRGNIREGLVALTAECLGSPNNMVLSAIGVDVEAKLLQIFLEEINNILNNKGGTDAEPGPV